MSRTHLTNKQLAFAVYEAWSLVDSLEQQAIEQHLAECTSCHGSVKREAIRNKLVPLYKEDPELFWDVLSEIKDDDN